MWADGDLVAKAKTPRLNPGDIVADRYRIDGIVGRGGFGAVYRATQIHTNQPVALKILLKNFANAVVDSKRFQREAALVQKLRHPNVVQLLDFGQTDKQQPFIAFELLTGCALGKVLKDTGAMPLYKAGEIARDVLQALEAAHALNIVHRDIKPQNIFLLEGGGAKVLDFGIAKATSGEDAGGTQLTEAGQMIGTPHYMAPEQVRGNGVVPGTDLYALGLLMAEMITGERVVQGNALIDIYMEHISDAPFDFDLKVKSCALFPVIDRATQKVIESRYQTATQMLGDLRQVLPGLGPTQAKTTLMPQTPSPSSPNLGGTFELPPEVTKAAAEEEPSPHSSTVLMSAPNLDQLRRAEAARAAAQRQAAPEAARPQQPKAAVSLDSTVDMVQQQAQPGWSSAPRAPSWPTPHAAQRSSGPPHSSPTPSVPHPSAHAHASTSHPGSSHLSSLQPSGHSGIHSRAAVHNASTSGLHSRPPTPHAGASSLHSSGIGHSGHPISSGVASSTPPVASGPLPSGPVASSGYPSMSNSSGIHSISGEHHTSGIHHHSGIHPPRAPLPSELDDDEGGSGLGWVLLAVAVLALAAVGIYFWAPWQRYSELPAPPAAESLA
jgi:serine/threonine-protein kinase